MITSAEESQGDQLHSREVRYLLMMSFRALCLIAAALLVGLHAPLLWIWIPLCLVGMVLIPWFAVLLANDRPPRKRTQPSVPAPAQAAPEERAALTPGKEIRIIDADAIFKSDEILEPDQIFKPE
ncbi:DUF3099 domain-containing protein [Rugosimonospora acidiphila]|uniref:DUF3099 domain-containing protein n=1 Tax=Rugosimonospora acidiphila TaxID=556531 RepID=A0ABP9RNL7_9ACTN